MRPPKNGAFVSLSGRGVTVLDFPRGCLTKKRCTKQANLAPLLHFHLNFEHAGPLVAVRIPKDRAIERLCAPKSVDGSRPNFMDAGLEIRLGCPPIPGVGTFGYFELRRLPVLPTV